MNTVIMEQNGRKEKSKLNEMAFGAKFKRIFIPVFALVYTLFIYLPTDTFINNKIDFDFTFQSYIFMMLGFAFLLSLIISFLLSVLPWYFPKFNCVIVAITIASYLQYLFFNANLAVIMGDGFVGTDSLLTQTVNLEIWIMILFIFPVLHAYKPLLMEKFVKYSSLFMIGLETVSIVLSLILSGGYAFEEHYVAIDGEEQYTVSKNENIIVFVMDAVDNAYLETILSESPEYFEGYKDYTLYTNTCSVYDATLLSLSQMFAGAEFDNTLSAEEWYAKAWNSEKANLFYEKFHKANYRVNAYNFNTYDAWNLKGKFDNYIFPTDSSQQVKIDHKKQFLCLSDYGLYRAVPLCFKDFLDKYLYDSKAAIASEKKITYYDSDFNESLHLQLSKSNQNYFIIQHLFGTHPGSPSPQGDYIAETKYILTMLNDFNNQLKKLGVYDNTTIIITSDHGEHNDPNNYEKAALPIFMIKEKNHHNEKMAISNAPVYHEDIMSTLLVAAGLYNSETDVELFGPSIYDFDEDSTRMRTWYDRAPDSNYPNAAMPHSATFALALWNGFNVYYSYTYTGDSDTLREMVRKRNITKIYPMKEVIG